jgi:integrase
VKAVSEEFIEAVLARCSEQIAAMIRFQRLTGCRPGEVCRLRACDIDMSSETWIYQPIQHKTAHRGFKRKIHVGPRSQEVLGPWLNRQPDEFLFSPREANAVRNAERRAARKSRVTPSQAARQPKENPGRSAKSAYSTDSYRRAIYRACAAAFPPPDGLSDEDHEQWRLDHQWFPNQLRHAAGTKFRRECGLEAAQVLLGHAHADVTQIYAERDNELAAKVAREVG